MPENLDECVGDPKLKVIQRLEQRINSTLEDDEYVEDPKLKVIQRLEQRINSTLEDESKMNMRSYKYLLENGAFDDHAGRYAVFHRGLVFEDTFESGDSFLNYSNFNNTTDSYTLYKIPGISVKPTMQMYHRTEVELSST